MGGFFLLGVVIVLVEVLREVRVVVSVRICFVFLFR